MFQRLAQLLVRRPKRVLVAAAVAFLLAGAFGGGVADDLSRGGFEDPGSESYEASELLKEQFGQADPNVVLLLTAPEG